MRPRAIVILSILADNTSLCRVLDQTQELRDTIKWHPVRIFYEKLFSSWISFDVYNLTFNAKEISKLVTVDFNRWDFKRKLASNSLLQSSLLLEKKDSSPWQYPTEFSGLEGVLILFKKFVLVWTFHCMGFTSTCLSISKNAYVVAIDTRL